MHTTDTHTHTHESEIENPVGLSRHYEEKVKVYFKKTNERGLYSLHPSLAFSLSRPRLENSMLSFAKMRCPVNQWAFRKKKKTWGEEGGKKERSERDGGGKRRRREWKRENEALKPVVIIGC